MGTGESEGGQAKGSRLPVVIIRPEPGASASLATALALGLDAHAFPLFAVRALPWEPIARDEVDALVLGSANALRHGGEALEAYRGLPAYVVGAATAKAASAAGLEVVATGQGGLQSVMPHLDPAHRRLLRLTGREHLALELPSGVTMTSREVYASEARDMPEALAAMLRRGALVLLPSGLAAAHFAQCCAQRGIDRSLVHLAAIGPRVTPLAGSDWIQLRVADRPDDAALLALALRMCQEVATGSIRTTDL